MDHKAAFKAFIIGPFALAGVLCAAGVSTAQALPDCWSLTYAALRHRAAAPHPAFVTYNESVDLSLDGHDLMRANTSVVYRDDGILRVTDGGFSYLTRYADPGPPELGPYGNRRSSWLPLQESFAQALPLIGEVRSHDSLSCANDGIDRYKDHETYRIVFSTKYPERPALKALWVDARSFEIWKVIESGPVPIGLGNSRVALADFEVELAQYGDYLVVDHVTWKYSYRQFWQQANYFGEYYYTGFAFPRALPAALFATSS